MSSLDVFSIHDFVKFVNIVIFFTDARMGVVTTVFSRSEQPANAIISPDDSEESRASDTISIARRLNWMLR